MKLGAFAVAVAACVYAATAGAAEVRLLSADPMAAAIRELAPQFEHDTGQTLIATFVSGPTVKQRIDAGDTFDLAISITPVIEALIRERKLLAGTGTEIASSGIGMGVRPGAGKPDIHSVDALKRTLLSAKSVAYSADGAGGTYFRNLLDRLGIAESMKAKLKPMPDDRIVRAVADGQAELVIGAVPNVAEFGAELVGPIPPEVQIAIPFTAAIGAMTKDADAAKRFIAYLKTPIAAALLKAKGMEPR